MKNGKLKVLSLALCLSMAIVAEPVKYDPKGKTLDQLKEQAAKVRKSEMDPADLAAMEKAIIDLKGTPLVFKAELITFDPTGKTADELVAQALKVAESEMNPTDLAAMKKAAADLKATLVFKPEPVLPAASTMDSALKHLKENMVAYIIGGSVAAAIVLGYLYKKYCDKQQNEEEQDSSDFNQ